MVLPEAMALGLPAISTNQAMSAHDFVRDQQNGFIGPAEDSSFLAQSMRYFLEHREAIPAFSKAARMAMTDYTPQEGARRLVNFVQDVTRKYSPQQTLLESHGQVN